MAKCHICGAKDDVIMGECASCREILSDQKTDKEIEDIWEAAGKQLKTNVSLNPEDFDDWA